MRLFSMKKYFLGFFLSLSLTARADTTSMDPTIRKELKRLNKCYALFVKDRIPETDPLWIAVTQGVKNGGKSGTKACMDLLSEADLNTNGLITHPTQSSSPQRGSKILSTFLDFHRQKLTNFDFSNGLGTVRNEEVHDMNTPAYHFVYSIFKAGENYSRVITRDFDVRAKRFSTLTTRTRSTLNSGIGIVDFVNSAGKNESFFDYGNTYYPRMKSADNCRTLNPCQFNSVTNVLECSYSTNYSVYPCCEQCITSTAQATSVFSPTSATKYGAIPWYPTLAEVGTLNGLIPNTLNQTIKVVMTKYIPYKHIETGIFNKTVDRNQYYEENVNAHLGAGFIGSQAYLLMNNNKTLQDVMNPPTGGPASYRIWTKSVFSDALCLDDPGLRSTDTLSAVRMNSNFPWRAGMMCMNCHLGFDGGAAAIRNLHVLKTSDGNATHPTNFFAKKNPTQPEAPYPELEDDLEFSNRPATAKLIFRDFEGTLIQKDVTGLAEYGAAIANTKQFFACGAKRYFEWLTGIPIDLSDTSNIFNPIQLTPSEVKYRKKVLELATKFQQHQSVKTLMESIIASDLFVEPDKGGD